jgi:hypothetical protein
MDHIKQLIEFSIFKVIALEIVDEFSTYIS